MGDLHYFTEDNSLYTRPGNVLDIQVSQDAFGHAASFPVKLPAFFVKAYSDKEDIWLDPFCGSGTTIVACEQNYRIGFGIEKAETSCAIILERYKQSFGVDPILIEAG